MAKSQRRIAKQQRRKVERAAKLHAQAQRTARWQSKSKSERLGMAVDKELIKAAAQYFAADGRMPSTPEAITEELMRTVVASGDLGEEPEFAELIINPVAAFQTYALAAKRAGMDLDAASEASDEVMLEIILEVAQDVLTEEAVWEVSSRLEQLQERWTEAGDTRAAARVALLHLAMRRHPGDGARFGLIVKILMHSVYAGMRLASEILPLAELVRSGDPSVPLADRVNQVVDPAAAERLFEEAPGLRKLLSRELNDAIDVGRRAALRGELSVGLFTEEELLDGIRILTGTTHQESEENTEVLTKAEPRKSEDHRKALAEAVEYVTGIMTVERVAQLRDRLKLAIEDRTLANYSTFLVHLLNGLEQPELSDHHKDLLVQLMVGELKSLMSDVGPDPDS